MHLETHLSAWNNKVHGFIKSGTPSRAHTAERKAHRHGSQALKLDGQTAAQLPEHTRSHNPLSQEPRGVLALQTHTSGSQGAKLSSGTAEDLHHKGSFGNRNAGH